VKVAIPMQQNDVRSQLAEAPEVMVLEIESDREVARQRVFLGTSRRMSDLLAWLREQSIDVVVCTRPSPFFAKSLSQNGIDVVWRPGKLADAELEAIIAELAVGVLPCCHDGDDDEADEDGSAWQYYLAAQTG